MKILETSKPLLPPGYARSLSYPTDWEQSKLRRVNERDRPSVDESPLLQAMQAALKNAGQLACGLRVSITRNGEWDQPKGETDQYWVKWLSWSVTAADGMDVTEPELAMVHGDFDQADFAEHLRELFPEWKCIVDNEIVMPSSG